MVDSFREAFRRNLAQRQVLQGQMTPPAPRPVFRPAASPGLTNQFVAAKAYAAQVLARRQAATSQPSGQTYLNATNERRRYDAMGRPTSSVLTQTVVPPVQSPVPQATGNWTPTETMGGNRVPRIMANIDTPGTAENDAYVTLLGTGMDPAAARTKVIQDYTGQSWIAPVVNAVQQVPGNIADTPLFATPGGTVGTLGDVPNLVIDSSVPSVSSPDQFAAPQAQELRFLAENMQETTGLGTPQQMLDMSFYQDTGLPAVPKQTLAGYEQAKIGVPTPEQARSDAEARAQAAQAEAAGEQAIEDAAIALEMARSTFEADPSTANADAFNAAQKAYTAALEAGGDPVPGVAKVMSWLDAPRGAVIGEMGENAYDVALGEKDDWSAELGAIAPANWIIPGLDSSRLSQDFETWVEDPDNWAAIRNAHDNGFQSALNQPRFEGGRAVWELFINGAGRTYKAIMDILLDPLVLAQPLADIGVGLRASTLMDAAEAAALERGIGWRTVAKDIVGGALQAPQQVLNVTADAPFAVASKYLERVGPWTRGLTTETPAGQAARQGEEVAEAVTVAETVPRTLTDQPPGPGGTVAPIPPQGGTGAGPGQPTGNAGQIIPPQTPGATTTTAGPTVMTTAGPSTMTVGDRFTMREEGNEWVIYNPQGVPTGDRFPSKPRAASDIEPNWNERQAATHINQLNQPLIQADLVQQGWVLPPEINQLTYTSPTFQPTTNRGQALPYPNIQTTVASDPSLGTPQLREEWLQEFIPNAARHEATMVPIRARETAMMEKGGSFERDVVQKGKELIWPPKTLETVRFVAEDALAPFKRTFPGVDPPPYRFLTNGTLDTTDIDNVIEHAVFGTADTLDNAGKVIARGTATEARAFLTGSQRNTRVATLDGMTYAELADELRRLRVEIGEPLSMNPRSIARREALARAAGLPPEQQVAAAMGADLNLPAQAASVAPANEPFWKQQPRQLAAYNPATPQGYGIWDQLLRQNPNVSPEASIRRTLRVQSGMGLDPFGGVTPGGNRIAMSVSEASPGSVNQYLQLNVGDNVLIDVQPHGQQSEYRIYQDGVLKDRLHVTLPEAIARADELATTSVAPALEPIATPQTPKPKTPRPAKRSVLDTSGDDAAIENLIDNGTKWVTPGKNPVERVSPANRIRVGSSRAPTGQTVYVYPVEGRDGTMWQVQVGAAKPEVELAALSDALAVADELLSVTKRAVVPTPALVKQVTDEVAAAPTQADLVAGTTRPIGGRQDEVYAWLDSYADAARSAPPPAPGMTRIYRAQKAGRAGAGSWFSTDLDMALTHMDVLGRQEPVVPMRLLSVDVPTSQLDSLMARNQDLPEGMFGMVGRPESDVVLPPDLIAAARDVVPGAPTSYQIPGLPDKTYPFTDEPVMFVVRQDGPAFVVRDSTGDVVASHPAEDLARDQATALTYAASKSWTDAAVANGWRVTADGDVRPPPRPRPQRAPQDLGIISPAARRNQELAIRARDLILRREGAVVGPGGARLSDGDLSHIGAAHRMGWAGMDDINYAILTRKVDYEGDRITLWEAYERSKLNAPATLNDAEKIAWAREQAAINLIDPKLKAQLDARKALIESRKTNSKAWRRYYRALEVYDTVLTHLRESTMYNWAHGFNSFFSDRVSNAYTAAVNREPRSALKALGIVDMSSRQFTQVNRGKQQALEGLPDWDWYQKVFGTEPPRSATNLMTGRLETGSDPVVLKQKTGRFYNGFRFWADNDLKAWRTGTDQADRYALTMHSARREIESARQRFRGIVVERANRTGNDPTEWLKQLDGMGDDMNAAEVFTAFGDTRLKEDWAGLTRQAKVNATKTMENLFFSYKQLGIDEKLRNVLFFHYWMSRAAILHTKTAIRNPYLLNAYVRAWSYMEKEAEVNGYPPNVRGFIRLMGSESGMYGLVSPASLLVPFWFLIEGALEQGDPGTVGFIQRWGGFLNPIVEGAAAAFGHSTGVPDVTATRAVRRAFRYTINFLNSNGYDGLVPDILGEPNTWQQSDIDQAEFNFYTTVNSWIKRGADALAPTQNWIQEYDGTNTSGYETDQLRSIVINQLEETYGPYETWEEGTEPFIQLDQAVQDIALGTESSNPVAEAAIEELADAKAMGVVLTGLLPGGVYQRYGPRDQTMAEARAGEDQAYDQREIATSGNPTLAIQTSEYDRLGSETGRQAFARWNEIVYTENLEPGYIVINGEGISTTQVEQMDQDDRKELADRWLAQYDALEDKTAYDALRTEYLTGHPEMGEFKEYQSGVSRYEGGPNAWRQMFAKDHAQFAEAMNAAEQRFRDQGKTGSVLDAEMEQWTRSPDAYNAAIGERESVYEEERDATAPDFGFETENGTTENGTGEKTSDDPLEGVKRTIERYEKKVDEALVKMQAAGYSVTRADIDTPNPYYRSIFASFGVPQEVPEDYWLYLQWKAFQPASVTLEGYLNYLRDQGAQQAAA